MKPSISYKLILFALAWAMLFSCKEDKPGSNPDPEPDTTTVSTDFDPGTITDTYGAIASGPSSLWGPYNVHDPSILKDGDFYYCYSTDVAYGQAVVFGTTAGHQIRRSEDLLEWKYRGTAFGKYPPKAEGFIKANGGEPVENLWAPYILKHNNEYRLYYSLASSIGRLSAIGLGVANSPDGPFIERDTVVTSYGDNSQHTNAIDPTIVTTPDGDQWMAYGSSWDGIWMLELDPDTGLPKNPGSNGQKIAHRGFTNNTINGNIEGAEIIYNQQFDKYYMFIAYDWLATKYNVRVVRADHPEGPYYDFNGADAIDYQDNAPMILAPYNFKGHSGWQGVSHPAVFSDGNNQYFIAHQGRPVVDPAFMVLHVRKIHWTEDGWPIVSPERYAEVEQTEIAEEDIAGGWEQIILGYQVVPGFGNEQLSPDLQSAFDLTINADGSLNDDAGTWTWEAPWLIMTWNNGFTDKVHVEWARDWENQVEKTLVFTGLNNDGTSIWGKKIN
ncbi:arabinan endo-1,5-alpha-L-arabinosidase [Fulvivirga ligni]|uniref:arabinan endo-1,5-alpha-L-arabinosidase n=1 Tax=Fulvivirga ligni TaxID=2904246 RepID=UPI001F320539|nr:arabinan endo-1,5-alpha-L-arabinosidase [Fulvivirga ligni]UII23437.1 arabinan endo-1,5-alpha-L-arabinosidase [Fulvivirga ligni]